jgi:hypothetical protein
MDDNPIGLKLTSKSKIVVSMKFEIGAGENTNK